MAAPFDGEADEVHVRHTIERNWALQIRYESVLRSLFAVDVGLFCIDIEIPLSVSIQLRGHVFDSKARAAPDQAVGGFSESEVSGIADGRNLDGMAGIFPVALPETVRPSASAREAHRYANH